MDDQFGGRTDDDLFFDEFEPVTDEREAVSEKRQPPPLPLPPLQHAGPVQTPIPEPTHARAPPSHSHRSPAPAPSVKQPQTSAGAATEAGPPECPEPRDALARPTPTGERDGGGGVGSGGGAGGSRDGPPAAPSVVPPASVSSEARLQSGANPRAKLTEDELAAKMVQMRLINAEKTRQFERAALDERIHAEAYARGMEEARRRRAAGEERRRAAGEEWRRMEDERERNRTRKLRAMGLSDEGREQLQLQDGGREDGPATFRGAYGGVRGSRSSGGGGSRGGGGGGLAGSIFASQSAGDEEKEESGETGRGRGGARGPRGGLSGSWWATVENADEEGFRRGRGGRGRRGRGDRDELESDRGGRGRGRGSGRGGGGGGGGGRGGGRGGSHSHPGGGTSESARPAKATSREDFPALPSTKSLAKSESRAAPIVDAVDTADTANTAIAGTSDEVPKPTAAALLANMGPVGKWDEEVEAMDAERQAWKGAPW